MMLGVERMRILYIDQHAAGPGGGDCRAMQLVRGWQEAGEEAAVLTAGWSHRRGQNPTLHEDLECRTIGGVTFCYLITPAYSRRPGESRHGAETFLKKLYSLAPQIAERFRPEVVISACGSPYDFFCTRRIAHLCRAKTVFELREPWPELHREKYPDEDSRMMRAVADYAMDFTLKNADLIVSLLPKGEEYLRRRGIRPHEYCFAQAPMPPLPHPAPLRPEEEEGLNALRERYPFLVAYTGSLSARRMPELLVEAVGCLQEQGAAAVLAGNGGYKMLLRRCIRENGWDNILLLDAMPEGRQSALCRMADAVYHGNDRKTDAEFGVYEPFLLRQMQMGRPLLMATHGGEDPVRRCDAGVYAPELTVEGVEAALRQLISFSEEKREKMGESAFTALQERHDPLRIADEYRSALLRLWR